MSATSNDRIVVAIISVTSNAVVWCQRRIVQSLIDQLVDTRWCRDVCVIVSMFACTNRRRIHDRHRILYARIEFHFFAHFVVFFFFFNGKVICQTRARIKDKWRKLIRSDKIPKFNEIKSTPNAIWRRHSSSHSKWNKKWMEKNKFDKCTENNKIFNKFIIDARTFRSHFDDFSIWRDHAH